VLAGYWEWGEEGGAGGEDDELGKREEGRGKDEELGKEGRGEEK
jgi:hypothetical protein